MAPKFQKGPDLKRFMVRHSLFFVVAHVVAQTYTGYSRHAFGMVPCRTLLLYVTFKIK
jgi:hypothetical protein